MKAERFTAWVFIFVVMGFMVLAPVSLAVKQVNKMTGKEGSNVKIDWEKLYPFTEGMPRSFSIKKSLYEYVKDKLEEYTSERLLGYYKIVEASKKYEDTVGWNMVSAFDYNAVVKLKDGYFSSYTVSSDVRGDAVSVKEFADFCIERGIDFMYINFPTKICKSEDSEISGVLDFANQNADKFLSMLRESGVKCYDFRDMLHKDSMKHHEAFFVTDHHWKPETGLWAAGHILKILRDDFGWNVNPEVLSTDRFNYVVYPKWFLGSEGKKVTLVRAKPENFTLIYPKYETNIKIEVPNAKINSEGNFNVIYDMKRVETKDYYNQNPYGAYAYGDRPLIRINNNVIVNGKKVLMIHNSFSDCVIPFVALGVQNLDSIDLRHFNGSLKRFIETENPNAIIIAYHATVPGRTTRASFSLTDKKQYDFR